jgi:hypothetical protein
MGIFKGVDGAFVTVAEAAFSTLRGRLFFEYQKFMAASISNIRKKTRARPS